MTPSPDRPRITALLTADARARVFGADAVQALESIGAVTSPARPVLAPADLPGLLDGATVCLTGWGTPPLSDELLADCPQLELVAHTAGSIRRLVSQQAMEGGLRVTHAADILARPVAEMVLSQALNGVRRLPAVDAAMRAGAEWPAVRREFGGGRLLGDTTVGVIGGGMVGRAVIGLLRAFGCTVLLYDPFLTAARAAELGVTPASLTELFERSDVVTVHAPVLPETEGMVTADLIDRLRVGAVFINTARGVLVDYPALQRRLRTGEISAALDVFPTEPLPPDDPIRSLPNTVLSPHMGGMTSDSYHEQGVAMVEEIRRFLAGEPLRHEISAASYSTMA